MSDKKPVLIIISDEDLKEGVVAAFEEQGNRIVIATTANEARLKFPNENFVMVIIDMAMSNFDVQDFVENIRRKEKLKSVREHIPVIIISEHPDQFSEKFAMADSVTFLQTPFTPLEFKKKLASCDNSKSKSNAINNNTKIIKKDEYLINEGENSLEMYWILEGKFVITKLNQDDQNVVIDEIFPGELVGEMSFLDNQPRSASVKALEDSEVLVIPHKKFIDVMEGQPRWFKSLMQTMSQRLRNSNQKLTRKIVALDSKKE